MLISSIIIHYVLHFCMQTSSVCSVFNPTAYLFLWIYVTVLNFCILHQILVVSFNIAHCFKCVYTSCWQYIVIPEYLSWKIQHDIVLVHHCITTDRWSSIVYHFTVFLDARNSHHLRNTRGRGLFSRVRVPAPPKPEHSFQNWFSWRW